MNINKVNAALNYSCNKFLPITMAAFIAFFSLGFETWEPYVIIGLIIFAQNFHYKVGYSVAICEERGLLDEEKK